MDASKTAEDAYYAWLNSERRHRELHFRVNFLLAKLRSKFSYVRIEGLTELGELLRSFSRDEDFEAFSRLQDTYDDNVAYQIFRKILEPTITNKHQKAERAISTTELMLALDVLQGCFLLHYYSKKIVSLTCHALELMLDYLDSPSGTIQIAALDVLLAMMVDSEAIQREFLEKNGIKKVVALMKQKGVKKETRMKCVQFLAILVRHFSETMRENKAALIEALGEKHSTLLLSLVHFDNENLTKSLNAPMTPHRFALKDYLRNDDALSRSEEDPLPKGKALPSNTARRTPPGSPVTRRKTISVVGAEKEMQTKEATSDFGLSDDKASNFLKFLDS